MWGDQRRLKSAIPGLRGPASSDLSFPSHPVPSILPAQCRPVPSRSFSSHSILLRPFVPPRPSRLVSSRPVSSRLVPSRPVPPCPVPSVPHAPSVSSSSIRQSSLPLALSLPFPLSHSLSLSLCLSPSPSLPHPLSPSSFRSFIGVGHGTATTARRPLRSNNSSPPHRTPGNIYRQNYGP